jgi:hypothetical protein
MPQRPKPTPKSHSPSELNGRATAWLKASEKTSFVLVFFCLCLAQCAGLREGAGKSFCAMAFTLAAYVFIQIFTSVDQRQCTKT